MKKSGKNNLHTYYISYSIQNTTETINKSIVLTIPFYVGDFNTVKRLYKRVQKEEGGEVFIYGFTHLSVVKEAK